MRRHLTAFVTTVEERTEGAGLPAFVTKEFRKFLLAYEHTLCRAVVGAWVRVLRAFHRRQARKRDIDGGETGMVTGVQRFQPTRGQSCLPAPAARLTRASTTDVLFRFEIGARQTPWEGLFAELVLQDEYDTKPAEDRKRIHFRYRLGEGYALAK